MGTVLGGPRDRSLAEARYYYPKCQHLPGSPGGGPVAQAAGMVLRGWAPGRRLMPGHAHAPALLLPRPLASPKRTVSPRDSRPASGGGRRPSISPHPGTLMSRPPSR